MGLKKGMTNNRKGRPKGSPNKVTGDIKTFFKNLLEKNRAQIERDLREVDGATRLRFYVALLPYVMPKLQSVQVTQQLDPQTDEIKNMSDDELEREFERIKKSMEE